MQTIAHADLIQLLAGWKTGAKFASLDYTSKDSGERARYTVILGFNYRNCVEKSLAELRETRKSLSGIDAIAADELLASFTATLDGTQENYTKADTYLDTDVPGIKVNSTDGTFQLFGLVHTKTVIEPGIHRVVKSAEKTIRKNALRKALPVGKFREFALDVGHLATAKCKGETIEF
jgi:hypothetical protein